MADPRDDRVSGAYRELPDDAPSPALDAAIQAAARRAVGSRPGNARRWSIPISVAAALVLAVAVSLQVEREQPMGGDVAPAPAGNAEYPAAPAEPEVRSAPQAAPPAAPASKAAVPPSESFAAPAPIRAPAASAPAQAAKPVEAERAGTAGAPAGRMEAARESAAGESAAQGSVVQEFMTQKGRMADVQETPERGLERIAALRAQGRHDEADRALVAFRRSFPDYRISDEWLRKVERRAP